MRLLPVLECSEPPTKLGSPKRVQGLRAERVRDKCADNSLFKRSSLMVGGLVKNKKKVHVFPGGGHHERAP